LRKQVEIPRVLQFVSKRGFRVSTQLRDLQQGKKAEENETIPTTPLPVVRENIYTIPNILTVGRILSTPLISYLVITDHSLAASCLFIASGLTDMIDGYIARTYNQSTVLGSILDPLADKFLMTVMTITLASKFLIPLWLAAIILGRDVGLSLSALWWRWKTLAPPKTMKRYWDPSLPSAEVKPTNLSKVNTALQIALLGACTAHPLIPESWEAVLYAIDGMKYVVAVTTITSGLGYIGGGGAVSLGKELGKNGK